MKKAIAKKTLNKETMNTLYFFKILSFVIIFLCSASSSKAELKIGETWCYDNPLIAYVGLTASFTPETTKFYISTYLNHLDKNKWPNVGITKKGSDLISQWFTANPLDAENAKLISTERMKIIGSDSKLKKLFLEAGKYEGSTKQSKISKCLVRFHLSGKITKEDYQRAKQHLSEFKRKPFVSVELNSGGGEVSAAISLGRLFREHLGTVNVTGSCLSACVLVYASGIAKLMDTHSVLLAEDISKIGVHHHFLSSDTIRSLSFEESLNLLKNTEKQIKDYIIEMGADVGILKLAKSTLPERIYYLNGEELRTLLPHVLSDYATVVISKTQDSNYYYHTKLMELFSEAVDQSPDWRSQIKWLSEQLLKIHDYDEWRMGPIQEIQLAKTLQFNY